MRKEVEAALDERHKIKMDMHGQADVEKVKELGRRVQAARKKSAVGDRRQKEEVQEP